MTAKRFEKAKFGTVIKDNSKQDTLWTATECIDRMNELAEENQDLKSFNKDLAENLSACANARISKDNRIKRLEKENNEIKQLIHTMLVQMEVENIGSENVRYWGGIIFTFKEFQKMREIWKGDF